MNYYLKEVQRIDQLCFSNKGQVEQSILTKRYIDQNYHQSINLALIAKWRKTSTYHLIRIFKKYHGLTPRQYLINIRISKAKELLKQGHSVSDTCYSVGFESIPSFSLLFKRKTGDSPSNFKKKQFSINE